MAKRPRIAETTPSGGMTYRDMTDAEIAQMQAEQAETERAEAMREPTAEERMEAQVLYTALMTDTLIAPKP